MDITVLQLHKRASIEYNYIQDRYSIGPSKKILALADGTTQSFKSETWAKLITEKFITSPTLEKNQISELFAIAAKEHENLEFEFSSNPAKASLEKAKKQKGSTATFLGVQILSEETFRGIFCGDTNLFKIHKEKEVIAFPFSNIDDLDQNSKFINTQELLQNKFDENAFVEKEFKWSSNDKIILATDALSRLILKEPEVINELLRIRNFDQLLSFCTDKWDSHQMEEDDISAIVVTNNTGNSLTSIVPPPDFSFPKEEIKEFIPASLTNQPDPNELSDMHVNQLMNQFRGVANDFDQIRQKLRFHQLLLLATIFLLIFNLAFTYVFSKNRSRMKPMMTAAEKTLQKKLTD